MIEFDAKPIYDAYQLVDPDGSLKQHESFMANYGFYIKSATCYHANAVIQKTDEKTLGKEAITCDVRTNVGLALGGYFDFTQSTDINSNPAAMTDGVYAVDIDFVQMFGALEAPHKCQFVLQGTTADGTEMDFAAVEFDAASGTIYMIDANGTKQGEALSMVMRPAGAGYLRLLVDMESKTVTGWIAAYDTADDIGYRPETADCLKLNSMEFYHTEVAQLTKMAMNVAAGQERPQVSGIYKLTITALDDATLVNTTANYDIAAGTALEAALTLGSHELTGVKLGETMLTEGTDYTASDSGTYTINPSVLANLPAGTYTVTFVADSGADPVLTVNVTNSALGDAVISPAAVTYDKYSENANHKDITVTLIRNGYAFTALKNGETELLPDTDYTIDGDTYTIPIAYLDTLQDGATLTFAMNGGTNPVLTIAVVDTAPPTYTVTVDSADSSMGSASVTTSGEAFEKGASVTITAAPAEGYQFTGWTAEGVTLTEEQQKQNPLIITVGEENITLTAAFAVRERTVTVSAGTGGSATITTGKTTYLPGEKVVVSAVATSGYTFSSWSCTDAELTVSGTTASFTMPEKDVSVYAYFVRNTTTNGGGGGGGRTSSSSGSTNFGAVLIPTDEEPTNEQPTNDDPYQAPVIDHVSSNYFNDTDTYSTWAYGYIEHLAAAGIVSGDQNGNYNPKNVVTREEFLKMLMGALGIEATTTTGSGYSDVNSGDWYAPYIYTGTELGLVKGMGDGTFGVGQLITRQDMAVMASRALAIVGKTLRQDQAVELTDLDTVAGYARSSVEQLAAAGVICGDENAAYRPADSALREDAAKIIYIIWKS